MNPLLETAGNNCSGHPRILLMEDEPVLAQGFQMVLKDEGYGVDLAANGQSALDTMRHKGYDLLVADLHLPDMDGMEVIRRVRQESPETRVIVITGHADIDSAVEALKTGAVDYLPKPLTEEAFISAVEGALKGEGASSPQECHMPVDTREQKLIRKKDVIRILKLSGNIDPDPLPVTREEDSLMPARQEPADSAQLLHQDKMMSLGRLAASIIHEINNPLSGILNYIRLMIKIMGRDAPLTPDEADKFMRYLTLVENEVSRCSSIVSNLLAYSRKSEVRFDAVDIGELLEKCILLSRHKLELGNFQVKTNVDAELPRVWGDFNQIQQCVINLIFNAIDAMDKGGILAIACTHNALENVVEMRIEDNGCGIAAEDLANIFNPFFTTKKEGKGLGLGLSTVSRIIEKHQGTIRVESAPGKGTAFIITLPVTENTPSRNHPNGHCA